MERDGLATLSVAKLVNFNSHAHVERDIYMGQVVVITGISTHTLTWSVTEPPREITPIVGNFNSHAHVERDDDRVSVTVVY